MKTATIVFKGFFADEVPYAEGVPAWECEPYTGLFENTAELMQFIHEVMEEPAWMSDNDAYPLAIITEYEITTIKLVDDSEVDFDNWCLKT